MVNYGKAFILPPYLEPFSSFFLPKSDFVFMILLFTVATGLGFSQPFLKTPVPVALFLKKSQICDF